jgi:hypothetical protein
MVLVGHMVTWSHGHMVTWSHGHMVTWSHGHIERVVSGCSYLSRLELWIEFVFVFECTCIQVELTQFLLLQHARVWCPLSMAITDCVLPAVLKLSEYVVSCGDVLEDSLRLFLCDQCTTLQRSLEGAER